MPRLNLLPTIFIVLVITGLFADAQSRCDASVLPRQAQALLNKELPNWRIKPLSNLETYDRELWLKEHPKECPGLAIGHFEDRGRTAYGLLLIPKSAAKVGYKIVVLASSGTAGSYVIRMLNQDRGSDSGLVISRVSPGRYTGFDTSQSVRMRLDGIEAEWIEKSSVLYFWKNGEYRTLQTSD